MADISAEAVKKAEAKVKQLVPNAQRVESIVRLQSQDIPVRFAIVLNS